MQNNVLFSSVDIGNFRLALIDQPVTSTLGNLVAPDNPTPGPSFINYLTGQYDITFPTPPAIGAAINAQVVPYIANRPLALLYYANQFILRPVPDQPYRVDMEVYIRPTQILNAKT